MDIKKIFNITSEDKPTNMKPALILGLLAVIIMGFGYMQNSKPVYEELEPPLYNKDTSLNEPNNSKKKKKHGHHHHKGYEEPIYTNVAEVETDTAGLEEPAGGLNTDEVPYTLQ